MPIDTEYFFYLSPLSTLYLTLCEQKLVKLEYEPEDISGFEIELPAGDIKSWLDSYFSGRRPVNTPLLSVSGTAFQQRVWDIMLTIPHGKTLTYGEVSKVLQSAPRAVGQACKRNPVPILIPCHRIVAKHSIGGYEGATEGVRLDRKKWLIQHEQTK